MIPFQLYCFDLSVTAECTEGFLSISTNVINARMIFCDRLSHWATVFLYPRLQGGGERETKRQRGSRFWILEGCGIFQSNYSLGNYNYLMVVFVESLIYTSCNRLNYWLRGRNIS